MILALGSEPPLKMVKKQKKQISENVAILTREEWKKRLEQVSLN